jgi:hypothetical protein
MAEKRVIELEIDANLGSLKEQLKAAKQEVVSLSEKFGSSSKQVANAADSVRSLEKEIKQTNKTLKSISFEGKFQAITGSIQGVVSGIEGVQGALGIIGIEGESVEKALLRVNSAMALSRGVEGLFEANKSFKQLSTFIKDAAVKLGILTVVKEVDTVATVENVVATEAQVVANQQAAVSFKATGVAAKTSLNGIKGAIAATGIGLLVIALGAIVVYWDDIKAAVSGVSSEQAKLNELSHANFETSKEQLSNLDAQDNVLKLQGKSEREILNLKIEKVNTAIKEGIIDLENIINTSKAEEAAAIQNYNMTKKVVDFILDTALFLPKLMLLPIDMAIKGANKVSEALGFGKLIAFDMGKTMEDMQSKLSGFVAGSIFNVPELKKENEAARKEVFDSIKDLRNQKAGFQLSIKEMDKGAAQTAIDTQKEQNDKLREYYDALEQERQSQITNAKEKELQEIDNKYEQLYLKADEANQSDKELIAKHQAEVTAINEKYAKQEAEAILKAKEEANKLRIQQEAEFQAQIEEIDEANFQAGLQKTMSEDEYALELVRQKYFALEEAAKGNAEQLAIIETAKALEIEAIDKKSKEKQVLAENELRQKKLQLAGQAFTAIADIMGSFTAKNDKDARKQFQIQKAFNLAAAVTNTAMAVTGALTAGGNPIKLATGMQFVEAGIAAATGAASIIKIASAKFGSGSSGGGGGTAPTATAPVMAPNFNVIGSSGVNQLAQIQQQPTRAYVVSGDVASGLSLERNRLQNASF